MMFNFPIQGGEKGTEDEGGTQGKMREQEMDP